MDVAWCNLAASLDSLQILLVLLIGVVMMDVLWAMCDVKLPAGICLCEWIFLEIAYSWELSRYLLLRMSRKDVSQSFSTWNLISGCLSSSGRGWENLLRAVGSCGQITNMSSAIYARILVSRGWSWWSFAQKMPCVGLHVWNWTTHWKLSGKV